MAKQSAIQSLLDTLSTAGEAELTELREAIAEKERARDAQVSEINREIDGLKQLEKALDVRINGKPARVPKAARGQKRRGRTSMEDSSMLPISPPLPELVEHPPSVHKVYEFLSRTGKPQKPAVIQAATGISLASVGNALKLPLFHRDPDGWVIAH
jgi:hypothetical protein